MQERYEMSMNAGTTFRHSFIPALEELTEDGERVEIPYELDSAIFKMYVRDNRRITFAEYTLPVVHDDVIGSDVVRLELPPAETSKYVPHRSYFYVIDMHHPSGDVERIIDGKLRIRPFTGAVSNVA